MDEIPFWKNLLIIAALPGLCEEFLFRGYILRSLRSMGKWPAILITGVLFGILHMSPFRIVPTALLGIWMGYLAWESGSLLLPMFAHMLNNALSLFIGRFGDQWEWLQAVTKDDRIAWWLVVPSGLLFYVLVRLFASINASPQEQRKIEE
jgi:membrane protease YdiL (CAAX protease family)